MDEGADDESDDIVAIAATHHDKVDDEIVLLPTDSAQTRLLSLVIKKEKLSYYSFYISSVCV